MTLPGELRNHIYALVFRDHVQDNKKWRPDEDSVAKSAALILTCKQVHQEALGIFYAAAVFESNFVNTMEVWGSRIGKERARLIRHARIFSSSSLGKDRWFRRERLLHDRPFIGYSNGNNDFAEELDTWYRTGLHGLGFPPFYVWTRDPESEARSWRVYLNFRTRHPLCNTPEAQAAAQKEADDLNFPSWIREFDSLTDSVPRGPIRINTDEPTSFWSTC
jgi:hypothetical protein